jgi:hypothetical protein
MKTFQLTLVFLFLSFFGFAQCPTDPLIELVTQQQVDDFAIQYPNCTELQSRLRIGSSTTTSDITNLNGLSQITKIGEPVGIAGSLSIFDIPNLTSLQGLSNLEYIGGDFSLNNLGISNLTGLEKLEEVRDGFSIVQNENLSSLQGVNSLISVGGLWIKENNSLENLIGIETLEIINGSSYLQIAENPSLESLEGLNNVVNINRFYITNNPNLENLDALSNVEDLGGIFLHSNESLVSIQGLSNVDPNSIGNQLEIYFNSSLAFCAIAVVCANLYNPNIQYFGIEDNALGCNTPEEIEAECNLSINGVDLSSISLYPNPITEKLQIHTKDYEYLGTEVYSVLGEMVQQSNEKQVDFSKLSSGIYFVKVETDRGSITKKVVKE